MKSSSAFVLALAGLGSAYPNIMAALEQAGDNIGAVDGTKLAKRVTFDAEAQYVSTSGEHKFVAPGKGDQRGPCPGLNAMANHGYLPHNGVATIDQFTEGCFKVFGMGVDLGALLAIYGAVFDGNLATWSIGGPTPAVSTGGLLGEAQGISGSHNKYEGDASPTRGDLYLYGNDYKLVMSQFQALFDMGKAGDSYDLDVLTKYRVQRFQDSIDNNPYFFNAPFSGVAAEPAAWSFIYRFMANKTEENPEGVLNGDVLKTFYAITGEDGDFTYTEGHERIPENWYKRAIGDEYTIGFLAADALAMGTANPQFLSIGGNTGTKDSFVGVDPADLTKGVFNADTLLEGNNLFCYVTQLAIMAAPDILSGLFTDIDPAMDKIGAAINKATNGLGCPTLNSIDKTQFDQFPGFTESYDGYSDPM